MLELAPTGFVAAEQGVVARADDIFVGGKIAVAREIGAHHRSQNIGLARACLGEFHSGVKRIVAEFCGALGIGDFRRAFEKAQPVHHAGCIVKLGEALQLFVELAGIGAGEAVRLIFDPDPRTEKVEFRQDIAQIGSRIGIVAVGPHDDVLDVRRMACLPQIGGSRHQHHRPVCLHHEALEEAESERVIAGQPVHAFLREQQKRIQLFLLHLQDQTVATCGEFFRLEVKGHAVLLVFLIAMSSMMAIAAICRP